MREDVEYLISQGHTGASRYPLAKVWSEVEIARRRAGEQEAFRIGNDKLVHDAIHGNKKNHAIFKKRVKELSDGGSP